MPVGAVKMKNQKKIRYYKSFTDDFTVAKNQDYRIDENYRWIKTDFLSRLKSKLIYATAIVVSFVVYRVIKGVKIKGAEKLKPYKNSGVFLFGNHTQPVADVFLPAIAMFPKRIYTVASPANLSIPVIGKILPYLGALPLSNTIKGTVKLKEAIDIRLSENACIVIYPEAHVWEYCDFIRPFPETSFKFPVASGKPSFSVTTTYQKRKFFKKPKITAFIDGPFFVADSGSIKQKTLNLHGRIFEKMKDRSRNNTCRYIEYKKAD